MLPLITVCKMKQYMARQPMGQVWFHPNPSQHWYTLMDYSLGTFSFGQHLNMTYEELTKLITVQGVNFGGFFQNLTTNLDSQPMFIQQYGNCWTLDDYPITKMMTMRFFPYQDEKYQVFVTDARRKTYFSIEFNSQGGDKMEVDINTNYAYALKLEIEDKTDPYNPDNCLKDEDDETFEECVEREVQSDLQPLLGCVPPWLSAKNHCNEIYTSQTALGKDLLAKGEFYQNYIIPGVYYDHNAAQRNCRKPCLKTKISVETRGKTTTEKQETFNTADILFNSEVAFKWKMIAYDFSNFMVDVGGLMGLWLGLSVLSIADEALGIIWSFRLDRFIAK